MTAQHRIDGEAVALAPGCLMIVFLTSMAGEQLKLEAALGNTLAGIARNLLCSGSSRFRHFSHFQVAVQHGYPNLNEQVCPLVGPAHLPFFAHRKLTTSLTADSATLLLMGMPRRYRHP